LALARGAEVTGAALAEQDGAHQAIRNRLTLVESDLRDMMSVRTVLEQAQPDCIIHLAAQSFVAASWQTPGETFYTNVISQMNLFERCGSSSRSPGSW